MTADTFQRIQEQGGVVNLSDRAKFLLTGSDRVRYLNGQVTQDVKKATPDAALYACVTNLKGKIEADIFIHVSQAGGEGLWLDAEPDLRETLGIRLERYIIADDVELTDVSDDWQLWHFFGAAVDPLGDVFLPEGAAKIKVTRFGQPGVDVWLRKDDELPPHQGLVLSAQDLETWRIVSGIPRFPQELNPDTFPQEAGLESSTMDFHKGCYIGQEILSRIKTSGKMPRKLVQIEFPNAADVSVGEKLVVADENGQGKEVGTVTSIAHHPVLDRTVGLAYVRQSLELPFSLLLAREELPRIVVEAKIPPL